MSLFDKALEVTLSQEAGYTDDPEDRGNWTSGKVGEGELKGTKYGISAMSYPHLDIKALTLVDAAAIYKRDYWDTLQADALPPATALVAFDICVNSGVGTARRFLALTQDPITLSHMRLNHYIGLSTWPAFGKGWARRTLTVLEAALHVTGQGEVFVTHEPDGAETVARRPFVWRIRGPRLDVRFTDA
jgi:lysozyme family protein